jgi:hypothetical protein
MNRLPGAPHLADQGSFIGDFTNGFGEWFCI